MRIIDLASPEPQFLTPFRVTGRLRIGHTWDLADQDEPVVIREADDVRPGARIAGGRCPGCVAKVTIGNLDDFTLLVLEHQTGCRWFTALLAEALP
jgi:hypothetical protein